STAATTTVNGDLIFGVALDDSGSLTTITPGTGFTQRLSLNNKDAATEDLVQVTAGSIAATQTFGNPDRYLAQMVAFKPAGTGSNAPPTVATPAAASPNPVTGTTTNLSVLGADDGGEANLTYTWATIGTPPAPVTFSADGTNAAKNVVATFASSGSYSLQVTIKDQGTLTVTSSVSVTVNPTLTTISVSPASATVGIVGTQQFTATGSDQFGVSLTTQPSPGWTVSGGGSISTTGLFTAGTTTGGPFTVTASSGGINGTASVTVTNAAPTVATPAAASPNPVSATTTNLSVLGADDGGEANLIYTWATTGSPPAAVTFSANGTNAAKNVVATFAKAGSYRSEERRVGKESRSRRSRGRERMNGTLSRS